VRLLANENFPVETVRELRDHGHDVLWIHSEAPGSPDPDVLDRARQEGRILVTFDKDFGELAFRLGLVSSRGVILFRVRQISPSYVTRLVVAALESRDDWEGHYSVIDEGHIRMVEMPSGA
jgi:predicted nuclease of predicted toxin-antitoxin system